MKRPAQPDLFARPSRVPGAAQRASPDAIEPFDFLTMGDATRLVPQRGWVVPEVLRLPTDDPEWMPGKA